MRLCTGLLLTILLCFIQTLASASSQKLLDELAKAPSVEEAQPIIDALWQGWINGHKSLDEKDLMGGERGRCCDAVMKVHHA